VTPTLRIRLTALYGGLFVVFVAILMAASYWLMGRHLDRTLPAPEADAALVALRAACADPAGHASVRLGPGDLLVINNTHCAHGRSDYAASFDGRDRWLQRVYIRHAIWPLMPASPDSFRVLA